jgi:hypothetical protein
MVHKLAIIAVIGLSASAVCIGAGGAIAGKQFINDFDLSGLGSGDRPRCEMVSGATATSREINWDGSDHVTLAVGGSHASYTPGTDDKVHFSGDPHVLAHVRLRDGKIELDCDNWRGSHDLQITLPGRVFKRFGIAGSGNLVLEKLDQEKLRVNVAGSGDIKADGKVRETEIHIAGSGDVNMGQVASRRTEVHIAGSGNTDIAPSEEAEIHIAGSGDVNLHSNPPKVETHIAGSGRIRNVGAGG